MSLEVPPALVEAAERGQLDEADFVACVRDSLPYAWNLISGLALQLQVEGGEYTANHTPPGDERQRGQLLRALASDAIRGALERHFGVRLAFQNCHKVAAFLPDAVGGRTYQRFVSPRDQVLNQTPELRDC
jgi:hypothetical protein